MSKILRTNEELLKCVLPVDRSLFPEARDNLIAQDYGKNKYIEILHQDIFFCQINEFKQLVDSRLFGQKSTKKAGHLNLKQLILMYIVL